MKPTEAAWVRENVWPPIWLRKYNELPGPFVNCACRRPSTLACHHGRHRACQPGEFPVNETVIQNSRLFPAEFPKPYEHRTPEDRHGHRLMYGPNVLAWVWPAGTPCREICPCSCHQPAPMPLPTAVAESVQLDLFAEVPA